MLVSQKVVLVSPIRYGYIRNEDGLLTGFKSGDRYVYVEPFDPPLPRHQEVISFPCVVIHHGKDMPCIACGAIGHKIGEDQCPAKPKEAILAFRSYQHPLSNHFPFPLIAFNTNFKSLEHAYFWRMSMEMDKPDLAEQIKGARHAGEAKRLSKMIAGDEERWAWERENIDVMKHLLALKAEQCIEFQTCLMENKENVLAEATPSKIWGTGLSMYVTANTAPNYWPGQNMLGILLSELTMQLTSSKDLHKAVVETVQENQQEVTPQLEEKEDPPSPAATPKGGHEGRPKTKTPPQLRTPRSQSTPIGHGKPGGRIKFKSVREGDLSTPSHRDIRDIFDKKRKTLASSPNDDNDISKQPRKEGDIT